MSIYRLKREIKLIVFLFFMSAILFSVISNFNFIDVLEFEMEGLEITLYPITIITILFFIFYTVRLLFLPFQLIIRLVRRLI